MSGSKRRPADYKSADTYYVSASLLGKYRQPMEINGTK
jgi:hypothetical protein